MNARITKNELIAINAKLAAENAALRAQLSALRVSNEVHRAASGAKRPLASFFYLNDAGAYITELKQRGCKLGLAARRDECGHFVVIAG